MVLGFLGEGGGVGKFDCGVILVVLGSWEGVLRIGVRDV